MLDDKAAEICFGLRNALDVLLPEEPRIQVEVLLLVAVRLRLDAGSDRATAYTEVSELLRSIEERGRSPMLSLVP
jgi:hypothetical protein